eukprot:gene17860-23473_t
MSSSQVTISTPRTQNTQEWKQQIKKNLLERVTPELLQEIQSKAEHTRRAYKSLKKVSNIERVNYLSSVSNARTLNCFSLQSSRPNEKANEVRTEAAMLNEGRQRSYQGYLKKQTITNTLQVQEEDDEEEEERFLDSLEGELSAETPLRQVDEDISVSLSSVANDIDALLAQLKVEPTDDNELIAKFSLYENFLETVTLIRDTTINFWNENKDQFTPAIASASQRDINKLDDHDNLGILDGNTSFWFVYYMTKKANQNSKSISLVLSSIKAKLSLLSQELGECPFCLEQMTSDNVNTVNCGHRTCQSCWDHWVELKRGRAFCPLCKYNDFVSEIVSDV